MHLAITRPGPVGTLHPRAGVGLAMVLVVGLLASACTRSDVPDPDGQPGHQQADGAPWVIDGSTPWAVVVQPESSGKLGGVQVKWQNRVVASVAGGAVAQFDSADLAGPGGRWLPPRGSGERRHLRFLGGYLHPDVDHWYRDVFRREDEVRVIDDIALVLGRRGQLSISWWLDSGQVMEVISADDDEGKWRIRHGMVEMEFQGIRGCRMEVIHSSDGTIGLKFFSPAGATGMRLLQMFRQLPPGAAKSPGG